MQSFIDFQKYLALDCVWSYSEFYVYWLNCWETYKLLKKEEALNKIKNLFKVIFIKIWNKDDTWYRINEIIRRKIICLFQ